MQHVLQLVQYTGSDPTALARGTVQRSNQSRRQPPSLVFAVSAVRLLPAVIFVDIFLRGRGSAEPNASRLYLLLRDAKRMLSTWAARSSIIIKSRGMIERCRMLIIAFRRVAAGRQVCFAVSTVLRIGVVDFALLLRVS